MTLPLVRTLQRDFPDATLTWIISKPAYYLVEGLENIEFIVIDKPKSISDYWALRQKFSSHSFDVLLAAQASLRTNLIYPLIKAKRKIGYDKRRAKDLHRLFVDESILPGCDHTLEALGKFAQALGAGPLKVAFDLPIGETEKQWAEERVNHHPTVVINPAASKPERCWLTDRYRDVIVYLLEKKGAQVILTGGPAPQEQELAKDIAEGLNVINLVGKTHPKQLAALIGKADVLLCPDTGPSHMGAAMGTPVIALHAVTNPLISGPYTSLSSVINYYPEAILQVYQRPAHELVWGTQAHDDQVMGLIQVDEVIAAIEKLL